MATPRHTYKYHFKRGNKILHTGITDDLERREQEHKNDTDSSGHIVQVGRRTTRDGALAWEDEQRAKGKTNRSLSRDFSTGVQYYMGTFRWGTLSAYWKNDCARPAKRPRLSHGILPVIVPVIRTHRHQPSLFPGPAPEACRAAPVTVPKPHDRQDAGLTTAKTPLTPAQENADESSYQQLMVSYQKLACYTFKIHKVHGKSILDTTRASQSFRSRLTDRRHLPVFLGLIFFVFALLFQILDAWTLSVLGQGKHPCRFTKGPIRNSFVFLSFLSSYRQLGERLGLAQRLPKGFLTAFLR